jgi:hypothetical protein
LQQGASGELLQEREDACNEAVNELDNVEFEIEG